jgi:hypothetical protein
MLLWRPSSLGDAHSPSMRRTDTRAVDRLSALILIYREQTYKRPRKFAFRRLPSLFSSTVVAAVVMAAATKPVSAVRQLASCQSETQQPYYRQAQPQQLDLKHAPDVSSYLLLKRCLE